MAGLGAFSAATFFVGIPLANLMTMIPADLAAQLATVRRPGDFFAAGTTELLEPLLEVEGVGPVALPLLPAQAGQLAAAAEPAPYGRGAATLVDPAVRRCRQIDPDRVRISGTSISASS